MKDYQPDQLKFVVIVVICIIIFGLVIWLSGPIKP